MAASRSAFKVYFGGPLFKFGELAGNLLLAEALARVSGGAFEAVLPQDVEHRSPQDFRAIRDADFKTLLDSDCALFNFDGLELDSGTVAEFFFAKSVDMPCALVRSDFRRGGDQDSKGDPWNLMCSFQPRSETALFNPLPGYRKLLDAGRRSEIPVKLAEEFAASALDALRRAVASKPLEKGGPDGAKAVLLWAVKSQGASLERLCASDPSFPDALLQRKISRGLI